MAEKRKKREKYIKNANTLSVFMVIILSGVFVFETWITGVKVDYSIAGLIMLLGFAIVVSIIRTTRNYFKLASNVPAVLFLFYTGLMSISGWYASYYLLVCLAICGLSCVYFSFYRTVTYIVLQDLAVAFLIIRGAPIMGPGTTFETSAESWVLFALSGVVMLVVTRSATISLTKAIEHQTSFNNLLLTTENYVAMVDESNKVVYASKTLSQLGNVEDPANVQGWPLIDLFPGKRLKMFAGQMLKNKDSYAEDWEFSLNGQKRYFKASSHALPGSAGNSLVNLYDMTYLAERDEIAAMKDSMKIGLFYMDQNCVIQDHYSRYLEELLSEQNLFGKLFTDVIANSVTPKELVSIKDYFGMVLENTYDQEMLDDINPLNELHYINVRTGDRKVFQCAFTTVERGHGELFLLVTVYDITARVELQQKLAEEEAKRQEEMQAVFELIQIEPAVFSDFMEDMNFEFGNIDKILKNDELSAHDALVKVYQSVHAIKSNAVILGLNVFGNKVHNLESKIKKLREQEGEVPFVEMLNLTVDIEKISNEREGFKEILDKLQSYAGGGGGLAGVGGTGGARQNVKVLVESLTKTTTRVAQDMGKQIKFAASEVDPDALDNSPRRVIKDILMQLIRNAAVHGIETPDDRKKRGKNETGVVKLSIKKSEDGKFVLVKLTDDGNGLDYKKIAVKAIQKKMLKKEDAVKKDNLLKVIFMPGFSTAETETVHGGRGIGLNLVRDRIKEVNGTIKIKSEDGKGTVFLITLPVQKKQ
jgi:two-component system, chemotaxis family, sensor kinase CheA